MDKKMEGPMKLYMEISQVCLQNNDYDNAILYLKKYLTIAQESGDKEAEMNAYVRLWAAHLKKKECDDGILYSEKYLTTAKESGDKEHEMRAYVGLGHFHLMKEEYDDAILYSEKGLAIAQESVDKEDEMLAYVTLEIAHLEKKEYDDAILYSEKCLTIAQESGDKVAEMHAYLKLGIAHLEKEEYDDSILYSEKGLAVAKKCSNKTTQMTGYYIILAKAHSKKKEYGDAISYSNKLLTIAQECGDKVAEKAAYGELGVAHLMKEEYDDAISYSKKGLVIAQEFGDKKAEMNAYNVLAKARLKKKDYDDAILYSKKWLTIAQESGDKEAEMNAYTTLGDAHSRNEEYDDAIICIRKCLTIAQESGDKENEMTAYLMFGAVHMHKGEYDDAISYSEKGLAIAQESNDKVPEMTGYFILGRVHSNKEEYHDAYSCLTKAIKIATDLKMKDEIYAFNAYFCMLQDVVGVDSEEYGESIKSDLRLHREVLGSRIGGDDLAALNYICYKRFRADHKYKEAILCLQKAMTATTQGNGSTQSRPSLWLFNCLISDMYFLLGEHDEAMHYQQEALGIACENGSKNTQAISHFSLGKCYYEDHKLEEAEKSLRESLKCYELLFHGLKENDRFKIAFVDKYKDTYKMLLKILIETNKTEEALALSEHYRARSLKDILVSSHEIKKEQIAMHGLQYADVASLVSRSNYTLLFYSTCFEKLCTFLVESGNELWFSVQHSEYCDLCLDKLVGKAFDEMKVRQVVNCADSSLDVMDDSEENKNRQEDELTRLLTRQKEQRLSEQCISICGCRGEPSENTDESSLLTSGFEILYHKLIQNIKYLIKQDEIVIIPEGPLCKVPFAALRDPDTGQYLSETKRIRMAPSIATLKFLQEYPEEHHSSKDALIIGASVAGKFMLDGEEKEFRRIDNAIEEADEIAKLLGVKQPLLAGVATKTLVIKRLQEGASVVHIAAHGYLKKATIVLAPSQEVLREKNIPDEEDYMLTMADVQQAQVRAQLVVLSCCYSGRGRIKAEGVIGMCRAFLASGARAVVGSLWAVNDEATFKFMVKFYEYLKEGKSASTSLHLTMNDMRKTPQYSEPMFWAPFFLMGDDVTIKFDD